MRNKKTIIAIIVATLVILSSVVYLLIFKEDKDTTLSLIDKQWIESNKNKVFDIAIPSNIPIFSYKGSGILFDFVESLEENTKLDLNPISYIYGTNPSNYSFKISKQLNDSDLLIYEDNYVLVSASKMSFNSLNDIQNVKIGVFENELELVNKYINTNVSFIDYADIDQLIDALTSDDKEIDLIAIPRVVYLDKVIGRDDLNIVYNITDLKEYYTISLGDNEKLNSIITKYFNKWYNQEYESSYKKYFNYSYFLFTNIDDNAKSKLQSKTYVYGFVNNAPYDLHNKGKLLGFNSSIIKSFTDLTDIDVSIEKYDNITDLVDDFNKNELDFIFNNYKNQEYKMDIYSTNSIYDEKFVIISSLKNNITINSINSILNEEVFIVDNTKIFELFTNNGNKVKPINTLDNLIDNIKNTDIAVIDYDTYYFYSKSKLSNFKIDYMFDLNNDYTFVLRDINDNEVFNEYLDFYLSFIDKKQMINSSYIKLFEIKESVKVDKILVSLVSLVLALIIVIVILKKVLFNKKKKKKINMSKADKLKYIDVLTSLKNRNYLNDHIEIWDDNEIYPQTVVVIDLNNIAYINDNYGHQEGDSVIKDAANILIKNQLENTEIIRTNGNEFLIYMIGYEEKQVVSYLRKINKELKDLSHGFGSASGYSMITDAIKTIDDAVNEATLDMRMNKEEFNNQ